VVEVAEKHLDSLTVTIFTDRQHLAAYTPMLRSIYLVPPIHISLYSSHLLQHRKLLFPCSLTQRVKLRVGIPEEYARSVKLCYLALI